MSNRANVPADAGKRHLVSRLQRLRRMHLVDLVCALVTFDAASAAYHRAERDRLYDLVRAAETGGGPR